MKVNFTSADDRSYVGCIVDGWHAFAWIEMPRSEKNSGPLFALSERDDVDAKRHWQYFDTLEEAKEAAISLAVAQRLERAI